MTTTLSRCTAAAAIAAVVVLLAGCAPAQSAGGYWIATGRDPGFGPYLDLLQWGPPSASGAMTGTLATYGMSGSSGPDGGAGQVISTTTTVTITGSSNLAISGEIGGGPVTDTATISGGTLTMFDPENQLIAPSPTVFRPGTPAQFSADLSRLVAEAPNGMADY